MASVHKENKLGVEKYRKRGFPVGRLGAHVKNGVSATFNEYFKDRVIKAVVLAKG